MPEERGYRRQVSARAATPAPLSRPEDYGAGLAAQVGQAAEQLHRRDLRDYQIQRQATADAEWARFQHGLLEAEEAQSEFVREARKTGGDGHAGRVAQAWDDRRSALLDGITEDRVRQRAAANFEQAGQQISLREADFEDVQRAQRTLTDASAVLDGRSNRARRLENADDYHSELEATYGFIDGLTGLSDDQKTALRREADQTVSIGFLRGRIEADPKFALWMMDQGVFDDALTPDQLTALRNGADVEMRTQANAAKTEISLATAEFRKQVRTIKEAHEQGIAVDADLPGMIEQARALGLDDVALDLDGIAAESGFAKIYDASPPVQREQRMAELEGKADKSADEQRELAYLKRIQGGADANFNRDPAGFFARRGGAMAPPALDFEDPESVARRATWAQNTSSANGQNIPPLTGNEVAALQTEYAGGSRAGTVRVLDKLGMMPADQAAAAARQIDPDSTLPVMVTLPQNYRALALDGRDALKANKAQLKPDDVEIEQAMVDIDARFAQALRSIPPAQRAAVMETGRQIAAGLVDQNGGPVSRSSYWKALNMALGAVGNGDERKGGLGRWGESWYLLPEGVSGTAFGAAVQRAAIGDGPRPVNPDGSPASLRAAFPVPIGNGVYEFHTATGAVVRNDRGGAWRVAVTAQ